MGEHAVPAFARRIAAVESDTLQVYLENSQTDPRGDTGRTTFQAKVRQTAITIHIDVYARQRSHIGEDLAACVDLADEIEVVLESQQTKP